VSTTQHSASANRGAAAVLRLAVSTVRELQDVNAKDPARFEQLLAAAWRTHASTFHLAANIAFDKGAPPHGLAALIAFTVIDAYFMQGGNWPRMVRYLTEKIEALEPQPGAS
jgi:hypothetical protein